LRLGPREKETNCGGPGGINPKDLFAAAKDAGVRKINSWK
jgi:hypothetical protein